MTDQQYTLTTAVEEERARGEAILLEEFGTMAEFEAALDSTVKNFDDGDIVEGVVVKVDPEEVLLDIGFKSEGVIPSRELSIKHDIDPNEIVVVGDVIEALVLQKEDKEGRLILSKKRAQYERAWGQIEDIHQRESTVSGTVIEVVKGGLILDIGLRGFLPASLVEMRPVTAFPPLNQPTEKRNIFKPAQPGFTARAVRRLYCHTRGRWIIYFRLFQNFARIALPLPFHAPRQAQNHDIQEAANGQPQCRRRRIAQHRVLIQKCHAP